MHFPDMRTSPSVLPKDEVISDYHAKNLEMHVHFIKIICAPCHHPAGAAEYRVIRGDEGDASTKGKLYRVLGENS